MKLATSSFLINKSFSIKQAMKRMSEIGEKVIFVVGSNKRLMGSLSDGDIRKWILSGGSLSESVLHACNMKPRFVKENYRVGDVKKLMLNKLVYCVPVVKNNLKVAKIFTWKEVFSDVATKKKRPLNVHAVVMAGGKGTRLDPFTRVLPKPLIPIGDKPIIEIIMDKFSEYGIKDFFVSISHKSGMIKSYFDETNTKYKIHYIEEKKPLGTAGSLRFLKDKVKGHLLITNCDIIIESDYGEIIKFHKDHDYDMTLVVSCRHYSIPYGVCEIETGGILKHINEKPVYDLLVNTGMYVMKTRMLGVIPANKFFNINDLVERAKNKGYKIGVFPVSENSWIDIGQWEGYKKEIEKLQL